MSTRTDPEDILYGNYPRVAPPAEDWHPTRLDVAALHLDDDGYFSFSGFSGCSEWMAKTEALPADWLRDSHYSPQNERSAENLFRRLQFQDHPDLAAVTEPVWIHPADKAETALAETEHHQYQLSVHKLMAIELLSAEMGEWRMHPYAADPSHPLLLYISPGGELSGLIRV